MAKNTDRIRRIMAPCLAGAASVACAFTFLFIAESDLDQGFLYGWAAVLLLILWREVRRGRLNPGRACVAVFEAFCLCLLALWSYAFAAIFTAFSPPEVFFSMSVTEGLRVLGLLQLCLAALLLRQWRCIGNAFALYVLCLSLLHVGWSFQDANDAMFRSGAYHAETPDDAREAWHQEPGSTSCNFFN